MWTAAAVPQIIPLYGCSSCSCEKSLSDAKSRVHRESYRSMADLDDFFAKKDRKKAKGKKFATTEEIAKKLEETGKRLGKKPKDKPVNPEGEEIQQTEVNIHLFYK